MKQILFSVLFLFGITISSFAKDGYNINVKFTDVKEQKLYLCHYFGKSVTVYMDDSIMLSKTGEGKFTSTKKIVGGIYILLFSDKSVNMEMILMNGDNISVEATKADIFNSAKFKGNTENNTFYDYQRYLVKYGEQYKEVEAELAHCKNLKDTNVVYDKLRIKAKDLSTYRNDFIQKNPTTFMAAVFNAVEEPTIPTELPTLPTGKKDSTFPRTFYKTHYWEKYNFQDDRLMYTPIYERKLDDYLKRTVAPIPDTFNHEADKLLNKAKGTIETFKYTLWYLTRYAESSKVMGMDESFVYLVENYYQKGLATWLDSASLAKYIDRAAKIAPNIINQPAPELRMTDTNNNIISLYKTKSPYTILLFWSPTCGHCQKEVPQFDSLYQKSLKKYGVQFFAVDADNEFIKWKEFISKNKLGDGWIHVFDPQRTTNFRSLYDVYSTPVVYLLDENKIIKGKHLDVNNILGLIEHLEKEKLKK